MCVCCALLSISIRKKSFWTRYYLFYDLHGRPKELAVRVEKCERIAWLKYSGLVPQRPVLYPDEECLPSDVSIDDYHGRLTEEAKSICRGIPFDLGGQGARFPWYLMQQVFLYLVARNAFPDRVARLGSKGGGLVSHYRKFIKFLAGQVPFALEERAIFLVLANTGFGLADLTPYISGFKYFRRIF